MQKTIDYLRITDRLSIYQRPERDSSVFYLRARIQGRRGYAHTKVHTRAKELAEKAFGSKDVTNDMSALFPSKRSKS